MSRPLIRVQGLRWSFPQASQALFDGLSFELPAGVSWLGGDEGRGKTTLLRLLAGQISPQAGQITFAVQAEEWRKTAAWYEPADPARDEQIVQDILNGLVPASAQAALPALLAGLSLEPHLGKPLYQLSTGSRRKVFIAATLATPAVLALLDQPFTALDAPSISFLREAFKRRAHRPDQALLLADYQAPEGVALAAQIDLDALA
jgi:ABC-type transport system involved in cytochrome c biogenesis ATPase subunit